MASRQWLWVAGIALLGAGCSAPRTTAPASVQEGGPMEAGKRVTVEGTAANAKNGALVETEQGVLWIDGMDAWPPGFYEGMGTRGKRVRVTGVLVEREDLPVFVERPGEPAVQGIPVPEGTDLRKASRRRLLTGATWSEVR